MRVPLGIVYSFVICTGLLCTQIHFQFLARQQQMWKRNELRMSINGYVIVLLLVHFFFFFVRSNKNKIFLCSKNMTHELRGIQCNVTCNIDSFFFLFYVYFVYFRVYHSTVFYFAEKQYLK